MNVAEFRLCLLACILSFYAFLYYVWVRVIILVILLCLFIIEIWEGYCVLLIIMNFKKINLFINHSQTTKNRKLQTKIKKQIKICNQIKS